MGSACRHHNRLRTRKTRRPNPSCPAVTRLHQTVPASPLNRHHILWTHQNISQMQAPSWTRIGLENLHRLRRSFAEGHCSIGENDDDLLGCGHHVRRCAAGHSCCTAPAMSALAIVVRRVRSGTTKRKRAVAPSGPGALVMTSRNCTSRPEGTLTASPIGACPRSRPRPARVLAARASAKAACAGHQRLTAGCCRAFSTGWSASCRAGRQRRGRPGGGWIAGMITSSIKPFSAATKGLAKRSS